MARKKTAAASFTIDCDYDELEEAAAKLKALCESSGELQGVIEGLPALASEIEANGTLARDTEMGTLLAEAAEGLSTQRAALFNSQSKMMAFVSAGRSTEARVKSIINSQTQSAGEGA